MDYNMARFSSKKGARFERTIRKKLTEATGVEFFRVPRSGGLVTSLPVLKEELGVYANSFKGDLFANNLAFLLELKNRASDVHFSHFVDGYGPIYDWWKQTISEAGDQLIPMTIFNTASRNKYCMTDLDGFEVLQPKYYSEVINKNYHVFIISFEHLLEICDKLFINNIKHIPSKYSKVFKKRLENK